MGPKEHQPPVPDYEMLRAPETHRFVSKSYEDCNWLQALEGGIDTSHSSFLHNQNLHNKKFLRNADTAPRLEVEKTDYGYRYAGLRSVRGNTYARIYHYVMPAQQFRGAVTARDGGINKVPTLHGHIWVPIDDTHTWTFNWMYSHDPEIPITREYAVMRETSSGRGPDAYIPGTYHLKQNKANDYLVDRQVQKTQTFTGIPGINTQDMALQEGMGPICDRSLEHLGTSDRAIIAARQLLLEALKVVEAGGSPRGADSSAYRAVRAVDLEIPGDARWQEALKDKLVARF
jgi:hypothetical protein